MQEKFYGDRQCFLGKLYQVLFSTTYFGLFRIGEMTFSTHVVKAWDVHIATNKKKMQFILWSFKTHSRGNKPQIIKITSNEAIKGKKSNPFKFCPFQLLLNYLAIRPPTKDDNEQFFVFADNSSVKAHHMRNVLSLILRQLNLPVHAYCVHGLRMGRTADLLKLGLSVETIKKMGHWKSNAVFAYLRD